MNYVPVRLSTLRANVDFDFNVYIQLKVSQKYILYVRTGDDISDDRLKKLKGKKVRQLFIEDSAEDAYQKFLDKALEDAMSDKMDSGEKATVAAGMADGAIEDMFDDPESRQAYDMTEKAAEGILNIVAKNKDILKAVLTREATEDTDIHLKHAVNVASMATTLAETMKLSEKMKVSIGTASMLMDIGRVKMPEEQHKLFTMSYDSFSKEEWKAYRDHPNLSVKVLEDKDYVTPEVLELVRLHEERKSGSGFPEGTTKIPKEVEIIGICDTYDRKVTMVGMTHDDAIKDLMINEMGNFDLDLINKFKAVLKKQGVTGAKKEAS